MGVMDEDYETPEDGATDDEPTEPDEPSDGAFDDAPEVMAFMSESSTSPNPDFDHLGRRVVVAPVLVPRPGAPYERLPGPPGSPAYVEYVRQHPEEFPVRDPADRPLFQDVYAQGAARRAGAVSATSFLRGEARRPDWVVEGLLVDGSKTVVGGQDKDVKSVFALELAVSLATGTPMFGMDEFATRRRMRGMLIQTEVTDDEQRFRLQSVLEARGLDDAGDLVLIPQAEALRFDLSGDDHQRALESREDIVRLVDDGGLEFLALDPLYDVVGDVNLSNPVDGRGEGVRRWITRLQARGCTVVVTLKMTEGAPFGVHGLYGDKSFRYWLEGAVLLRATYPVDGEVNLKVQSSARRYGKPPTTFRLRGRGLGLWERLEDVAARREAIEREREPREASLRERVDAYRAENPDAEAEGIASALGAKLETVRRYLR